MADSTSGTSTDNSFLKSWGSCETIVDDDEDIIFCYISKEQFPAAHLHNTLQAALNDTNPGDFIVFKSIVILTCEQCPQLAHLHCRMNFAHMSSGQLLSNELPVKCTNCISNHE